MESFKVVKKKNWDRSVSTALTLIRHEQTNILAIMFLDIKISFTFHRKFSSIIHLRLAISHTGTNNFFIY